MGLTHLDVEGVIHRLEKLLKKLHAGTEMYADVKDASICLRALNSTQRMAVVGEPKRNADPSTGLPKGARFD